MDDGMSSGENNRGSCGWVMELVIDLLQSVLDLLTDHWVNISIISQFYSNIFYFLDHSLLSSLMEMIKEQNFVTSHNGPAMRTHLNMLEGWACGIGLKEEVLENLARLSAAADLLATEEAELVQVSSTICVVCSIRIFVYYIFPMHTYMCIIYHWVVLYTHNCGLKRNLSEDVFLRYLEKPQ